VGTGHELIFGPAADQLEPRAIPVRSASSSLTESPFDRDQVRVAFRTDAASESDHSALSILADAETRELESGLSLLECKRNQLAPLAEHNPTAAMLLAASDAACQPLARPKLMGILNVTPDSFSDGGEHNDVESATARARAMALAGADIIDVGGESTRPGSEPVDEAAELERVLPVIESIRAAGVRALISIDTRKSNVAARALEAGANWVNDTSAGAYDSAMLSTVAGLDCPYVAMHMRGTPRDMQDAPRYEDPVHEILCWLRERAATCLEAGISPANLIVDPGIGFGKRPEDNVALVRRTTELRSLGLPILGGVSRKAFLGQLTGIQAPDARLGATAAAVALCVAGGAEILRVHDVELCAQVIAVSAAHNGLFPTALLQP